MTKIKNCMSKIKEYFEKNIRVAVLILFLLELFISIWITPNRYDSAFFIEKMQEMSMLDFLSMRYSTWTSRIIIEFVVCTILPMGRVVWTLINTIMMSVLGYGILYFSQTAGSSVSCCACACKYSSSSRNSSQAKCRVHLSRDQMKHSSGWRCIFRRRRLRRYDDRYKNRGIERRRGQL